MNKPNNNICQNKKFAFIRCFILFFLTLANKSQPYKCSYLLNLQDFGAPTILLYQHIKINRLEKSTFFKSVYKNILHSKTRNRLKVVSSKPVFLKKRHSAALKLNPFCVFQKTRFYPLKQQKTPKND